jgi:hypothetical protein
MKKQGRRGAGRQGTVGKTMSRRRCIRGIAMELIVEVVLPMLSV